MGGLAGGSRRGIGGEGFLKKYGEKTRSPEMHKWIRSELHGDDMISLWEE